MSLYFSKLSELTNQLEKITKELDDARAEAQQAENDLREELEKERMNAGRKDRDIQVWYRSLLKDLHTYGNCSKI